MNRFSSAASHAAILCHVLVLTACGGGGGGSGSPTPPPAPPPVTFTVGGTLAGLAGNSVVLRLNGGADLIVAANGNFTFPGAIANGTPYTVTVQTQPAGPAQICALANATGNIAANVSNVTVSCTTTYRVRGTLSGLAGGSVVLRNNGSDDLTLSTNGPFLFAASVPNGGAYAVTVQVQPLGPSQTCVVTQGSGNVAAADVTDAAVNCTINTYAIGGTVTGLNGPGLMLSNNGGNDLAVNANGAFTFSSPVASAANYLVTVRTHPAVPPQRCTATNAGGTVLSSNITHVAITCVNTYALGGTVRGLDVAGLVLRNSGDDLTVNANGSFSFATRVPLGMTYNVTAIANTPASPRHVCQIVNGVGAVNTNADVTNVQVTCEADRFAYVAHTSTVSFNGPGLISAVTMNHETGALAPIAGTSTIVNDNGGLFIASDPRGRFIYVAHSAVYTAEGSVSGFSVNPATGALTPVPGSPFPSGSSTSSLAIDSEGLFLYAVNSSSNDLSGWKIEADGSLTPVPGSPYLVGSPATPVSVATTPAGKCCYVYVAHSGIGGTPQVAAYAYHHTTGALTLLPGSPFPAGSNAYNPRSLEVNSTGELLYMANGGTSNFSTFDISGAGTLTERSGSPTPAGSSPCVIHQPRLSPSLFVVSILASDVQLYGSDPGTGLPLWLDTKTMFSGSYCSAASDPYGKFVYLPNSGNSSGSDYLFGFMTNATSTALLPLTLSSDPLSPANIYTLPALMPRAMVVRYSRRDREVLQVPD